MASSAPSSRSLPSAPGQDILGELLSSRVRAAVLSYLVAREDARFSLTELARALGLSISSVQHECYKLERLGVLKGRREGASRRYWLDRETPFVPVLMWLVVSVIGEAQVLQHALADVAGLEGSLLTLGDRPSVTLIGDIDLSAIATVQERVAKVLQTSADQVDVAFFSADAWSRNVRDGHPAVHKARAGETHVLTGERATLLP